MNQIIEKRFQYKGFPCVVMFMPWTYHRCGYVGVPRNNKYYGMGMVKLSDLDDIECHGGVTYCDDNLFGQDDTDTWWIGFDCMHAFDARDIETAKKYYADDPEYLKNPKWLKDLDEKYDTGGTIKTMEFVEAECKKIVDQISDA